MKCMKKYSNGGKTDKRGPVLTKPTSVWPFSTTDVSPMTGEPQYPKSTSELLSELERRAKAKEKVDKYWSEKKKREEVMKSGKSTPSYYMGGAIPSTHYLDKIAAKKKGTTASATPAEAKQSSKIKTYKK
jgi:hypothetical protein